MILPFQAKDLGKHCTIKNKQTNSWTTPFLGGRGVKCNLTLTFWETYLFALMLGDEKINVTFTYFHDALASTHIEVLEIICNRNN